MAVSNLRGRSGLSKPTAQCNKPMPTTIAYSFILTGEAALEAMGSAPENEAQCWRELSGGSDRHRSDDRFVLETIMAWW